MSSIWLKKGLVFGIIVMLIGVIIVPIISGNYERGNKFQQKINDCSTLLNLDNGLIGYWSFDEGTDNTTYDDSGNTNDGMIYGASWTSDAISGKALHFDAGDYVTIGNLGEYVYTMIFWVKPDNTITKDSGAPGYGNSLHVFTFNTYQGYNSALGDSTALVADETITICQVFFGDRRTAVQNQDITSSDWHMIAYVWNSGLGRYDIYFDNVVKPVTYGISIGHVPLMKCTFFEINRDVSKFEGSIDEVRIYNRILSSDELQKLWRNPAGLKTSILIGKITNLNVDVGNLMIFKAEKLLVYQFCPLPFLVIPVGYKIKISEKYIGIVTPNFVFGLFKANI